jgi:hypothetical protein
MQARYSLFFRLIRIECWMFLPTEANVSCSNLSAAATCEHMDYALSPTHLQSIGGGDKSGEPDRCSPDTPRLVALEDPGARVTSPRVALLRTSMSLPRLTKSHSKLLASSLSWGSTPSTSTLVMPYDVPSSPSITRTHASCASNVGSSDAEGSIGATAGRSEPGVTTGRLPTLVTDDATKGGCRDVTGHVTG